jgi:hypothetical protein
MHEAPPGANGPAVFSLAESAAGSGIWTAQASLTEAQASALSVGNYYVNVQSASLPNGEIRGQLVPQSQAGAINPNPDTVMVISVLTGTLQAPPTSGTPTAVGTGIVDTVRKTLTAAVTSIGIAGTDAHVHHTASGLVLLQLTQTSAASGIWVVKAGLTDAQMESILTGNTYFDIHSAMFSGGDVRGEIVPQDADQARFADCGIGGFNRFDCDSGFSGVSAGFGFLAF